MKEPATIRHIKISEVFGTDVSSRASAARLRSQILSDLGKDTWRVVFDFEGVRTLSGSFADELLAVIAEYYGSTRFKEHIGFKNVADNIRQTILESIEDRLDSGTANLQP